jgi:hypothetical protein
MLIDMTADKTGTSFDTLYKHFKANEYVVTPFLHEVNMTSRMNSKAGQVELNIMNA